MEILEAFLGVLVASSGPPEDLLAVKWAPRAVLKGPLRNLVGTSGPSSQEVPSWRSLRDPLGIARGAQERFWATKIVPWNGPGPLPGTKIVILRRFRACPFSSPQTGPIHKETLRGGSGDVWEHHFRPKLSFYKVLAWSRLRTMSLPNAFFSAILQTHRILRGQMALGGPNSRFFSMKYGARKGGKMTSKVAKTFVKR